MAKMVLLAELPSFKAFALQRMLRSESSSLFHQLQRQSSNDQAKEA